MIQFYLYIFVKATDKTKDMVFTYRLFSFVIIVFEKKIVTGKGLANITMHNSSVRIRILLHLLRPVNRNVLC